MTLLLAAVHPVSILATDGKTFVADANVKRAGNGRPPVAWNAAIDQITVERGDQMAAADTLEHDMAYVRSRLDQLGVCWTGYGEIIYWTSAGSFDPQQAVDAWYRSTSGHKEIMLGDYNAAAGSWSRSASGGTYAVMVFVKTCSSSTTSDTGESIRVSGSDRYATAAALSRTSFSKGVPVAYVATGANFPDALAAGPAATHAGGPVLLVTRDEIPGPTATELSRLQPARIVVLGGSSAVGSSVAKALMSYATTGEVRRIAGADRYDTAARISAETFGSAVSTVYVATGENFADALAGGAAAGMGDGPILLVRRDSMPNVTADELARLRPDRVVILGGRTIISDAVASAIGKASGAAVDRIYGSDRYQTAVKVSRATMSAGEPTTVYVATGANFPDGLAAGPVAGSAPGPLLLVPGTYLPDSVAAELARLAPDTVVVLGGSAVISDAVVNAIDTAVP